MRYKSRDERGLGHILLFLLVAVVIAAVGFIGYRVVNNNKKPTLNSSGSTSTSSVDPMVAGKQLSGGQCDGSGETTFTHLPMDAGDFAMLQPYGLTVGGHVTPIDHQYFSPADFHSAKDQYPVYAMADAKITNIEVHPTRIRLVFTVSCTFFYYYDLVTSVQPGIDDKHLPISVKAGQLIGRIGGQTLDFAVWNTKKPLSGFINPDNYKGEAWKIYTADPTPYYATNLKQIIIDKSPRVAEPQAGKLDYDIDGKLIGNWFLEGSGGYSGNGDNKTSYWQGHLSIAPDPYDPSATVFSVGNYDSYPKTRTSIDTSTGDGSGARQYFAKAGSMDPAKIGMESGVVKFELVQRQWVDSNGNLWDNMHLLKAPKAKNNGTVVGTVLAQLTGKRTLKFEAFPNKYAEQVTGFDSNVKIYTR